jgi:nucleoside-diphosphate-sugar epimerase
MDAQSMANALKGTDYIVHTASPFPLAAPKDEMEIIRPAVDGTLAVMEAAKVNKCKKVVITSSVATVMFNETVEDRKLNWNDWSPEKIDPYPKSKLLAEKAAWDFIRNLPQHDKFPIVTINPGFILGPNLNEASFTSGEFIKK